MKSRDAALEAGRCALLVVDLQQAFCRRGTGLLDGPRWPQGKQDAFFDALEQRALPNAARLVAAFRAAGQEVIHTVIQSLTRDGRDRSLDHKLSDFHIPRGDPGGLPMPEVAPAGDEILLPKTASGVFNATNIEYLLRNMGIAELAICGVFTNQCVESAVRDAADRGFYVTLVDDACAGTTPEEHAQSVKALAAYGRVRATAEVLAELRALGAS